MELQARESLDTKVKSVWRVRVSLALVPLGLIVLAVFALMNNADALGVFIALGVLWMVSLIVCIGVFPSLSYAYWRYSFTSHDLVIIHGIIWRTETVIPFIRVQNTDTKQGPLLRMFSLKSVSVATAAGTHEIPGLALHDAETLRDRIAEAVRLAKEDV